MPFRSPLVQTLFRGSFFYLLTFAICLLNGCAKVGTLTGGAKDTTPPRIDSLHSTANRQVNFSGKEIKITFDEWVKLDRPNEQILLSPPLVRKPVISLKGKTVHVQLPDNEALRANTTYTLNFGNAVQDFHEGNALAGLRYVFSTGLVIDSLEIKGLVADAFTGQPVDNCTVMLYDVSGDSTTVFATDSLIKKGRPNYFARTDKAGNFSLQNLRGGQYRIVAVEDQNLNYRLDLGERTGFFEKNIALPDSALQLVKLRLFKNQTALRVNGNDVKNFGLVRLFFNEKPAGIHPDTIENRPQLIDFEEVNDSIYVWYDGANGPFSIIFGKDTIGVKPPDRAAFLKKQALVFVDDAPAVSPKSGRGGGASRGKFGGAQPTPSAPANATAGAFSTVKTIQQNPKKPLELMFNRPILTIDTAFLKWADDSSRVVFLKNFALKKDSLSPRKWLLENRWTGGKNLRLTILPGALTDYLGEKNRDTLRRNVSVLSEKQLGALTVNFTGLETGKSYLFELLNGDVAVERRVFEVSATGNKFAFAALPVGQYGGRLIEDLNKNGRWDSGSFDEKRQPEIIFTQKFETLKPDWEQEVEFSPGGKERGAKGKFQGKKE